VGRLVVVVRRVPCASEGAGNAPEGAGNAPEGRGDALADKD
jgi:hypothetical protein